MRHAARPRRLVGAHGAGVMMGKERQVRRISEQ